MLADNTAGRQLVALGFPSYDAKPLQVLSSAISHEPLKSAVKWHPTKDIVALDVLLERRASTVWVWSPSKGLRKIGPAELANVVGIGKLPANAAPTLAALAKQWKGDKLLIEAEYNVTDANASYGVSLRTASLVYDAGKDTLANQ